SSCAGTVFHRCNNLRHVDSFPVVEGVGRNIECTEGKNIGEKIVEHDSKIHGIFNLLRRSTNRSAESKPSVKSVWVLFYQLYRNQAAFGRTRDENSFERAGLD